MNDVHIFPKASNTMPGVNNSGRKIGSEEIPPV
jgi:hypothetical protein